MSSFARNKDEFNLLLLEMNNYLRHRRSIKAVFLLEHMEFFVARTVHKTLLVSKWYQLYGIDHILAIYRLHQGYLRTDVNFRKMTI